MGIYKWDWDSENYSGSIEERRVNYGEIIVEEFKPF